MTHINDLTDAINYTAHLGFWSLSSGKPIAWVQSDGMAVVDALEKCAGGYPYQVTYHRAYIESGRYFSVEIWTPDSDRDKGEYWPHGSSFTVKGINGTVVLKVSDIK